MSSNAIQLAGMIRHDTKSFGITWVALCIALAVHVTDEALTDFLSVYNPAVLAIRRHFPLLPFPTFTFEVWLTGLILAVVVLLSLSTFAFQGARWLVPLTYLFGFMMLGNGVLHIGGSVYLGRLMPGVYSAPLLLAGSLYLLASVHNRRKGNQ